MSKQPSHAPRALLTVSAIALLIFAFISYSNPASSFYSSGSSSASACSTPARPVFVWMFGYVGNYYYPQTNNSVTPAEMISAAKNISGVVGASNLRIVEAVDVEPGHNINQTTDPNIVSTIRTYVSGLKVYSSMVYGRMDMEQFTNYKSISAEMALYSSMGVTGVFFDLAPILYSRMGQNAFNHMMQELTINFPNVCYIMNQTSPIITITPLGNDTWQQQTYVSPTVSPGSLTTLAGGLTKIENLNKLFPGRVIIHYDANGGLGTQEPMAYFADHAQNLQESAIHTLDAEGLHPASGKSLDQFNVLIPVFGAWSAKSSIYHGTLYNGLSVGTYHQNTLSTGFNGQPSFLSTMKTYP
jgi:hypothetical protein